MQKYIFAVIRPLLAVLCLGTASAQSITYILDYDTVPGSTVLSGFEDKIEVLSYSQGVGRAVSAPTGPGGNREASVPSVGEMNVLMALDPKASIGLLKEAHIGEGKTVKLKGLRSAGQSGFQQFMEIELTNTMISGLNQEGSNGNQVYVNLTLNFTKIKYTIWKINPQTGEPETPESFTYDVATQVGS